VPAHRPCPARVLCKRLHWRFAGPPGAHAGAAVLGVAMALVTTGATMLVAGWLSAAAQHLPPLGVLGMMLLPGATVLVMAPTGAWPASWD
jgi:hypothetical protein